MPSTGTAAPMAEYYRISRARITEGILSAEQARELFEAARTNPNADLAGDLESGFHYWSTSDAMQLVRCHVVPLLDDDQAPTLLVRLCVWGVSQRDAELAEASARQAAEACGWTVAEVATQSPRRRLLRRRSPLPQPGPGALAQEVVTGHVWAAYRVGP